MSNYNSLQGFGTPLVLEKHLWTDRSFQTSATPTKTDGASGSSKTPPKKKNKATNKTKKAPPKKARKPKTAPKRKPRTQDLPWN